MKVQEINTEKGKRYILIGDDYRPVQVVNNYLKSLDIVQYSPNTLRSYAFYLKSFYEYMSLKGIDPLTFTVDRNIRKIDVLANFISWLQYPESAFSNTPISPDGPRVCNRTINNTMVAVYGFYQYLSDNGIAPSLNEFKGAQNRRSHDSSFLSEMRRHDTAGRAGMLRMPEIRKDVKYITREEYNALFHACNNRRDKILIGILFEGGLRIGEALGAHIGDFNIEDNVFNIVPRDNNSNGARVKNCAAGSIYLPPYLAKLISDYINEELIDLDTDYFFVNLYDGNIGEPMTYSNVANLFNRLSERTGVHVHPHMERHGFAHEKRKDGMQMSDIQSILRHKNPATTGIYTNMDNEEKVSALKDYLKNRDKKMEESINAAKNKN
jgi:integrase